MQVVESVDVSEVMLASPSMVRLPSGRLLAVHERVPKKNANAASKQKRVRFLRLHMYNMTAIHMQRECMTGCSDQLYLACGLFACRRSS